MTSLERAKLFSQMRLLDFTEDEIAEFKAVEVDDNFLRTAIELCERAKIISDKEIEDTISHDPFKRQLLGRSRK